MPLKQHYTPEQHHVWQQLYARMTPRWERYANEAYLNGLSALCFDPDRIPQLESVNRFLFPLTRFRAKAVGGYLSAFAFFDCLSNREFPTTITIREAAHLDYLPEPDIFHDIAGHVPMHTGLAFAETLVRFGQCAHTAADRVAGIRDQHERLARLSSMITAMARFFWFTIEFGLMRSKNGLQVYGSGLLSSYGEIEHSIQSQEVQRSPLQLEWAIHQTFEINRYQPLLFIVDSFDHLFSLVDNLDQWMREGKLDHVANGEPKWKEEDLKSFLEPGNVHIAGALSGLVLNARHQM